MLRACVVLFALVQLTSQVAQQPPGTAEIRGRVTDRDSGQPLARALVRLHSSDGRDQLTTQTDETGLYRFTGLTPGEYSGLVDGGPFRSSHQMGFLSVPGRPLVMKDGEVREVHVALARTYAIDVRVVDEFGDPLSGIRVNAHSPESGRAAAGLMLNHTTDDLGRQRVSGLQPGRYIVCAEATLGGVSPGARGETFMRTCHPSATDEAEAQVVRVDGSLSGELEIRMRRGRTYTVSGRILDASGTPAPAALLMLSKHRSGGTTSISMLNAVNPDGEFRIDNVHPGDYAIEASVGGPERPEQRRPTERAFLPVRVDGADMTELVVTLQKTVDVAGRITLDDPDAPFVSTPGYAPMFVWARLADEGASGSFVPGTRGEDRQFTLAGVFGPRILEVLNVPRGWYMRSIRYHGDEIIDVPTIFKDGPAEPVLEVILSTRGAVAAGRVTDDRGQGVGRAMVLIFDADPRRMTWRLPTVAHASPTGDFRVGPVRAGDYFMVALPPSTRPVQPGEPNRLRRLAAVAKPLTLGEPEERTIDLRLVQER